MTVINESTIGDTKKGTEVGIDVEKGNEKKIDLSTGVQCDDTKDLTTIELAPSKDEAIKDIKTLGVFEVSETATDQSVEKGESDDISDDDDDDDIPKEVYGWANGCVRDKHLLIAILSIAVVLLGIMKMVCHFLDECAASFFGPPSTGFWVTFGAVSAIFVINVFMSHSFHYLCHMNTTESAMEFVDRMHKTAPEVRWHIQCYHFETRTRLVSQRDANGNTTYRTETYTVRVNTHAARGALVYVRWEDVSEPLNIEEIQEFQATKLSLKKSWTGDEGAAAQKAAFIARNNRDVHYDFNETLYIEGFTPRMLTFVDIDRKPWLAHWTWYLLSHVTVVFALPYRMWLSSVTNKVRSRIVKKIWTAQEKN